jgi:ubiquinone/menaquinone biosynthesis C-methylase UbiE
MVIRAKHKTAAHPSVSIIEADAFAPPLQPNSYDLVLCRHVLWAMPDPAEALDRWIALLNGRGRLVLIEVAGRREPASRRNRLSPCSRPQVGRSRREP